MGIGVVSPGPGAVDCRPQQQQQQEEDLVVERQWWPFGAPGREWTHEHDDIAMETATS